MRATADDPAREWLLTRVDGDALDAVRAFLELAAERLATVTADAVTIRRLDPDGETLSPVAAFHPNPEWGGAMAEVMGRTMQREEGLWGAVMHERRAVRWYLPVGAELPDASPRQADFLRRFPIRAILSAPLVHDDRLLGGVAVVRFGCDVPYTEQDEHWVTECAERISAALHFDLAIRGLRDRADQRADRRTG